MSETGQHEDAMLLSEIRSAVRSAYPPPAPWADLRDQFAQIDSARVPQPRILHFPARRSRVNTRWLAAVASVLIGIVVFRLSTQTTLSAAELLRDASVAESRAGVPGKVRVVTRSGGPAAERFARARYDWSEPLSVRSFAAWRDALEKKDDRVQILRDTEFGKGRYYRVTTTTPAGELAEASITIRADGLKAVHERFVFRDGEWVEAREEVSSVQPSGPRSIPPQRLADGEQGSQTPAAAPTPSDELKVVAALHGIGADLGDPVEVHREADRIRVVALGGNAEREAEIRTALSGLRFVELRVEKPEAVRAVTGRKEGEAEPPKSSALLDRLAAALGDRQTVENFTNHVMDLSEAALARAHALRALATRFPAIVEATLSADDRAGLAKIEGEHAARLAASVRQLSDVLRPVAKASAPGGETFEDWQSGTEAVLRAALELDRTVTEALAGSGGGNPDTALSKLAANTAGLQVRVAALQTIVAKAR